MATTTVHPTQTRRAIDLSPGDTILYFESCSSPASQRAIITTVLSADRIPDSDRVELHLSGNEQIAPLYNEPVIVLTVPPAQAPALVVL